MEIAFGPESVPAIDFVNNLKQAKEKTGMNVKDFFEALQIWKSQESTDQGQTRLYSPEEVEAIAAKAADEAKKRVLTEYEAKKKAAEAEEKKKQIEGKIDEMVKRGQLPPSAVDLGLKDFLLGLESSENREIKRGLENSIAPGDWMIDFLSRMKPSGIFDQVATNENYGLAKSDQALGKDIASRVNR